MNDYVIVKQGTRQFVAREGCRHSYTPNVLYAQRFKSKEEATKNCCGNEIAVSVDSLFERI